jgi:hypothetical protein
MKTRRGRGIAALLAVAVAALAMASVAWACTTRFGQTYIDGYISYPTAVSKGGTVPRIGAKDLPADGPASGSSWSLRAGKSGCCSTFSKRLTPGDHTLNRTDADGWPLGQVNGTAPSGSRDQGTWKVCFLDEPNGTYATNYAAFTVN